MMVCDICMAKAVTKIIFTNDDQRFDLCQTHKETIVDLITTPAEKKPVESRVERQEPEKTKKGKGKNEP